MLISIDPSNGTPIYEQIVRQVKYNVANGSLVSGQQVPSVRDLAKMLAINPNTIQRAYQLLQSDGVLETVRGRGQHVSPGAKRSCISQRARVIHEELAAIVEEALQAGLEPAEMRESFETSIRKFQRSKPSSEKPGPRS